MIEKVELFNNLLNALKHDVVRVLCHVQIQSKEELERVEQKRREALAHQMEAAKTQHEEGSAMPAEGNQEEAQAQPEPFVRDGRKVGRNEVCPCGSGKKFKQCHGKIA